MNVYDTIQALQSTIDELSFYPADTELKIQTDKLIKMACSFAVEKTGDVITVTIKEATATPSKPDDDDFYYGYP